ncbi:MAG TPA: Lrp/AsnC family transcriptional regulator [Methanosarcinales archaeon]|nr:Lrp/AsnC family transcriptional regulator [Methanosarcinales archaeon]
MNRIDKKLLECTQDGIPIVPKPFKEIANKLNINEDEVLNKFKALLKKGIIRRFSASIGHRALGITANAMCVWNVPDDRVDEVGKIMASFPEVTHCYERPRYSDWKYNLFTMIHSYEKEECISIVEKISKETSITDYNILFSEKEFKKTGVRFSSE